jgi:hypothetical protein
VTSDQERLAQLGIATVAIFDDEDPEKTVAQLDSTSWLGLISGLESGDSPLDPTAAEDLRRARPSDRLDALRVLRATYPDEVAVYERGPVGRSDLGRWVAWFEERGAQVDSFKDWPSFTAEAARRNQMVPSFLGGYGLVLLDYKFNPADQGEISKAIAEQISSNARAAAEATSGAVPILARLTTENIDRREADVVRFARDIEFPRSAYLSFVKSDIRGPTFSSTLLRELKKARTGTTLFMLTTALRRSLFEAVQTETLRLFELDAGSVRLLNNRALEPAGVSQAEHWVDVTSALVLAAVRESADVATSARGMLEALMDSSPPGLPSTLPALSRIENRVRFDYAVNRLFRPIDCGDIFVFEDLPSHVAVLITQACDLAVRAGDSDGAPGIPERRRVTLLLGKLGPNVAASRPEEERVTDFVDTGGGEFRGISWEFDSPVMIPRSVLDLVTLRPDGRAVVPSGVTVEGAYWTAAFGRYLSDAVAVASSAIPAGKGSRGKPIRFVGTSSTQPALGSLAEYARRQLAGTREPYLGIRRVARLRSIEAQRVIDRSTYLAGRVALPSSMPEYVEKEMTLRFAPLRGQPTEMIAKILYVGRGKASEREAVIVDCTEFRARCATNPAFAVLGELAAEISPLLDIQDLLAKKELSGTFALDPGNNVLLLRESTPSPQATVSS